MSATRNTRSSRHHPALKFIAVFKLVKAVLMLLVALAARRMLHHDIAQWARDMADHLQMHEHSHYIRILLVKLGAMQPHSLEAISAVAFGYAALLSAEGIGLWMEKRWAEYLTVVVTVSLVPVELYELWLHATVAKLTVLGINIAVAAYLMVVLRKDRRL